MIKKIVLLTSIFTLTSCTSYVTVKKYNEDTENLKEKISILKKDKYQMKIKLDAMDNRLLIVENQIISLKKKLKELKNNSQNYTAAENENKNQSDELTQEEIIKISELSKRETEEEPIVLTNSMLGHKSPNKNLPPKKHTIKNKKALLGKIKAEYKHALNLHRQNKFDESIEAFNKLIKKYSKVRNSLTDNFYYWLGENYLSLNDIPLARKNFNHVIKEYPKANKVPDSMFKLGFILEQEGRTEEAIKKYYNKLVKKYSDTEAGKLAAERLLKLKHKEE